MLLFLEGLVFGLIPVFFVGPVLFTLLAASLDQGFAAGALVAAGIAVSDVVAVGLVAAGLGPVLTHPWGDWLLHVVGGLILVGFGVVMAATAARPTASSAPARAGSRHFAAGFAVNFVNPFVFAFWVSALGGVGARHGLEPQTIALFFGGTISTIFVTDLLKAWAAGAVRAHLDGPVLVWARRVGGALLLAGGAWLLVRAVLDGPPAGAA